MSLDVPNRFFKMGFDKGRKQGALEEFEKLNCFHSVKDSAIEQLIELRLIIYNRLKELECEKE